MRAWRDTEAKRRWAATPSTSPEGGSGAASRTEGADTCWEDGGNRFGNLSGNPMDGRMDQFARGGKRRDGEQVKMRALGNWELGRN